MSVTGLFPRKTMGHLSALGRTAWWWWWERRYWPLAMAGMFATYGLVWLLYRGRQGHSREEPAPPGTRE
jgi:hypothetical protein